MKTSPGRHFILTPTHEIEPVDLLTWAHWLESAPPERVVALTTVGDHEVSTVFLGLDHGWSDGPPVLFETMIFTREKRLSPITNSMIRDSLEYQTRCCTYAEAVAMHDAAIGWLRIQPAPTIGG